MNLNLGTKYLGLQLANPLVIAACPITGKIDWLKKLEEAGAAAAVMPSLFEEQIEHEEAEIANARDGSPREKFVRIEDMIKAGS